MTETRDPLARLLALGLAEEDARTLLEHFLDAERRGKTGHGLARIAWLETQEIDPTSRPRRVVSEPAYERWDGAGALGYLTLAAAVRATLSDPPDQARVVVLERCFPTGVLGAWVRMLAEGGLVAVLTATSPRRLPHPDGGEPLTGTNPLAIAVPSSDGLPLVADVSMGAVTHGDVLAGPGAAGGARPLRRPARAQGIRTRRRARASRRRPRRLGARRGAARGAPGARSSAGLPGSGGWAAVAGRRSRTVISPVVCPG